MLDLITKLLNLLYYIFNLDVGTILLKLFYRRFAMNDDFDNVFFKPWIGENYWTNGYKGLRILVIGNSHYCSCRDKCECCGIDGYGFDYEGCEDMTTAIVEKYLDRKQWECWMRTYQNFEYALYGQKTNRNKSQKIWNSIAFYNYLQTAVSDWKDQGNDEDYNNSEAAFWEVLEYLQPDCIIMWGNRVWNQAADYNGNNCYELNDGNEIYVLGISHPAWKFFGYKKVYKKIKNFLDNFE